jgi:hypothetical protein
MKFTALINQLNNIFDYSLYCASQHHYLDGCTKFWAIFYLSSSLLLLIICIFIGYKIHKENIELKNYLQNKAKQDTDQPAEPIQKHA